MPDGLDFSNQAEPLDFSDQAVAAPSRQFASDDVMDAVRLVESGNRLGLRQEHRPGTPDSAIGPYGIKPSTGARPGYGVAPIADWDSPDEHRRFAADYLEALSAKHGSLERGLAAYNADPKGVYAPKVMASVKKPALDFSAQAEPLDFSAQAEAPTKQPSTAAGERPGIFSQAGSDFERGLTNLRSTGAGFVGLLGDVVGADGLRDWGLRVYKEAEEEANTKTPAVIGSYKNIHGLGDAGRYAVEAVAENLPMMLPSLFTGGVGAKIAQVMARKVVEKKVAEMVAAGVAKEAAEKAVAAQVAKKAMLGAGVGAGAATVGQESGSIYGDIFTETGEYRPGVALLFGTAAGALDVLPQLRLIGKFFPAGGEKIVGGLVKRLGKAGASQFLMEAGTEGLQTVIEKAAVQYVDPDKQTFSDKNITEIIDSILKGGISGGVTGAVAEGAAGVKRGRGTTKPPPPPGKATPDEAPPLSPEAAAQVPPAQTHIGFSPGNDEDGNPLPQDDASVVGLQPNGTVRIVFTHTGQTRDIDAAEFLEAEKRLPTEAERATNLAAAGMPGDKREQTASVAPFDKTGENQIGGRDPSQSLGQVFYDLPASILDDLNFGLSQNGTAEQRKKEADKLRQIKLDFLRDADSVNRTLQSAIKQQADAKANENHGQAALLQGSISDLKRKGAAASLPIPKRGATDQELADWYTNKLELAQFENDPNGERLEAFMRGMSPEKKADFARWAIWGKEMANPDGASIPVPDRGKRVPQGSVGVPGIPSHLRDVNAALKMEAPAPGTVVTREQAAAFNLMRTALNQYRDQNPDGASIPVPDRGEGVPAAAVGEPGRGQLPNVGEPTVWPEIRHGDAATPAQVAAWARLKTELGQYQGNPEGVSPTPIPAPEGADLGELGQYNWNPERKEPILPPRKPQTVKDIKNEVADEAQRLNKENKAFRLAPATKKGERRFLAAPENIAQAVNRLGGWLDPIRGKHDRSVSGQVAANRGLLKASELKELVAAGKSRGHTYLKLEGQELKRLSARLVDDGFPPPGSSPWQAEGDKKRDDGGREAYTTEWTQDELVAAINEATLRSTRDRKIADAYEEQNRRLETAEAEAQNNADEYAAAMAAWERGERPQEEGIIPPVDDADGDISLQEMDDAIADQAIKRIQDGRANGVIEIASEIDAGIADESAQNGVIENAKEPAFFDYPEGEHPEIRTDEDRAGETNSDAEGAGESESERGGEGPVARGDQTPEVEQQASGAESKDRAPPLELKSTDAAAKRPPAKQLGLAGEGFVSRDEKSKMKPKTGQKGADEGLFKPKKDERQTDIEDNSGEPGAEARQEAPGEPMTVYRGSGRSTQSEVYNENSAAVPIFGGDGKFYAFDQEHAKYYGPNVETATIQPRNPFYIRSDDQWRALTKRAGWRVPNPFGQSESEVKLGVERLMKEIGAGHDAVMVTWDDSTASDTDKNGNSIKTLRDVFGVPQVFIPEPPKKSPRAASKFQRTEGSTKQQPTDTPEFKRWFGDSKVVDENGEPLRVYHSTILHEGMGGIGDVTTFDRTYAYRTRRRPPGMDSVGIWFSDNPDPEAGGKYGNTEDGGVVYPVYLNMKNPWRPSSFDEFLDQMHLAAGRDPKTQNPRGRGSAEELRDKLKKLGYDGIIIKQTSNRGILDDAKAEIDRRSDMVKEYQAEYYKIPRAERDAKRGERLWKQIAGQYAVIEQLEKKISKTSTSSEFDNQTAYIAFEPSQIKSATGNSGAFDPKDPRITFSHSAADQASDNEAYDDPDGERFHIAHDAYGINYPGNEAKRQEAVKIVREAIERVVGPVQIKVFDRLMGADDSGKFTPTSGLFERVGNVIMAALESSNLTHTGRHEVIHFLMQNDMLPPHMRRAMEGMADQWVKLYEIKKHYPDLDAAGQREEGIAEAFAHWNDKPETFKDSVKQAFQAIKDIFNSIANAFRDKGVYTYRDAFRAIDRGDMKGRIEGVNDYTAHPTGDGRFALKDQRDGGVLRIYDTRKEAVDAAHGLEAAEIAGRAMERQIQSGIINPIVAQVARGGAAAERKFVATARQALPVNEVGAVNFPDSTSAAGLKSLSKIGLWITFPRAMATWDRLGAAVYRAYDNIGKESHRLQSKYATMMAPYTQLTKKQRTRVNAALEIARLTKSNIRDGKGTLIVTNDNLEHAVHSEVGDSFRLTDKEKAAFHSVQNMHRQQWSDRLVGVAREFGYDGRSTNPAEIMKYFSDKIKEEQANGQSKDSTKKAGAQGRKEFAEAGYDVIQGFDAQRRNGYTPLRRYGDERVDVRLKETGELVYTTFMNEGKGDTLVVGEHFAEGHKPKSPQQLTTMEKLRAQYPSNAYEVTAREVGDIPKMPSNLRAILGALKNAGGKGSNLDAITVKKEVQQIREYYKSEMMRHAQDYPGYSADFERAIADNLMSMANGTARATYRAQYENAMWDIDNHTNANLASYRNNKKFWKDYDTYMQDKDSGEFSAARQLSFLYFLSSAGSAIVNLTQTVMVAVPNIGQWGGGRGASNFLRAIPSAVLGFRANLKNGVEYNSESLGKNSQERELLRDLSARGVLSAQNVRDMQGLNTVKNPDLRPLGNQAQKVINIMTSMFSASETANRALTALIAYRTALAPGAIAKADSVYKNNQLYQRMRAENDDIMTPQLLAEYTVEESQLVSGPQNRPKVARGAGAWLTQFKLYPWQMLENMTRIARQNGVEGKIAAAVMIAALVATAGLGGIPFAEDMVELANWVVNLVAGRDVGLDLQAKEWMKEFFGQTGADIILNGASKSQLGISLERRFGMGNMIPGAQVSEWLGMPYAMTVGLASNIYQRWKSGQPLGAIAGALPALPRQLFEAGVVFPNEGIQPAAGQRLTVAPNEFTLGAQLARILGFKSALEVKRVGDFWANERQKSAVTEFTRSRYENIGKPLYWSVYWAQQGDKGKAAEFERQYEAAVAADAKENGALPLMWQQELTPAQFKAKILGFLDPELAQFMLTPKPLQADRVEKGTSPPTPKIFKQ